MLTDHRRRIRRPPPDESGLVLAMPKPQTTIQRRLIDASGLLADTADEITYQHSILCQTSLPYRDPGPDVRRWVRRQGDTMLEIDAGRVVHPELGEFVDVPLPHGAKARLVLMHLNAEAIRTQSARIDVGNSLTTFVQRMGFTADGRTIRSIKDQLTALSTALIRLGFVSRKQAAPPDNPTPINPDPVNLDPAPLKKVALGFLPTNPNSKVAVPAGTGKTGLLAAKLSALSAAKGFPASAIVFSSLAQQLQSPIVEGFALWLPKDARQRVLWPSYVHLNPRYFESLRNHAVPLDERAIGALSHSALALDVYAWLAQRLHRIPKLGRQLIPWVALKEQFGSDYARLRKFREVFMVSLRQVHAVYPAAKIDVLSSGLLLHTSPPPIARSNSVVKLPASRAATT